MPGPEWAADLEQVWAHLQSVLDRCGGYLVNDVLDIQLLGPETNPDGLMVHDQRVRFWDESLLEFTLVVNADLVQVHYNFHFRDRDDEQIWRKDKHSGHEAEVGGGLCHIHDDPGDWDACRSYGEVDLREVMEEIHQHHDEAGGS